MKSTRKNINYYLSLNYPLRVEPIPDDLGGGWVAYIPVLGEKVFRATGDTAEEALHELEELKEIYFQQMLDARREIPLPPAPTKEDYSGQFLVRTMPSVHAQLAARAAEEGVSLNHLVVTLLNRGLGEDSALQHVKEQVDKACSLGCSVPLPSSFTYVVDVEPEEKPIIPINNMIGVFPSASKGAAQSFWLCETGKY